MPGWRDFERATASALGGTTRESKSVFDVEVPAEALPYGLSCKTSKLAPNQDYVLMEMANSAAKFADELVTARIDYEAQPHEAGCALIALIMRWHAAEGASLDVARSSYLVLTHDPTWTMWRLFWYGLNLSEPDPQVMTWARLGKHVAGFYDGHKIWEWYPGSGSQLKYRPLITSAKWASEPFQLEDAPLETPADRAKRYWPSRWPGDS